MTDLPSGTLGEGVDVGPGSKETKDLGRDGSATKVVNSDPRFGKKVRSFYKQVPEPWVYSPLFSVEPQFARRDDGRRHRRGGPTEASTGPGRRPRTGPWSGVSVRTNSYSDPTVTNK